MHIAPFVSNPAFEKVASHFEEPSKILMCFDFVNVPTLEGQMSMTAKMTAPVFLSPQASYFYRLIS